MTSRVESCLLAWKSRKCECLRYAIGLPEFVRGHDWPKSYRRRQFRCNYTKNYKLKLDNSLFKRRNDTNLCNKFGYFFQYLKSRDLSKCIWRRYLPQLIFHKFRPISTRWLFLVVSKFLNKFSKSEKYEIHE